MSHLLYPFVSVISVSRAPWHNAGHRVDSPKCLSPEWPAGQMKEGRKLIINTPIPLRIKTKLFNAILLVQPVPASPASALGPFPVRLPLRAPVFSPSSRTCPALPRQRTVQEVPCAGASVLPHLCTQISSSGNLREGPQLQGTLLLSAPRTPLT